MTNREPGRSRPRKIASVDIGKPVKARTKAVPRGRAESAQARGLEPDGTSHRGTTALPGTTRRDPTRLLDGAPRRDTETMPDEEALFGAGPSPRMFGEGGYASGGAANQGNYESQDKNPHGNSGTFNDAGGYGGTELLGDRTPIGGRAGRARTRRSPPKTLKRSEPK